MKPLFPLRALALAGVLLLAVPLAAQIPIGGTQSGTLAAGVYLTTSTLTVAPATTWTLSPGVIIKFTSSGHRINVNGTLNANGTSVNPVILTDDADDSAGGDTNGNGPSTRKPDGLGRSRVQRRLRGARSSTRTSATADRRSSRTSSSTRRAPR